MLKIGKFKLEHIMALLSMIFLIIFTYTNNLNFLRTAFVFSFTGFFYLLFSDNNKK